MSIKEDLQKAVSYGNAKIVTKRGQGGAETVRDVLDSIDTIIVDNIKVDFIYIDPVTGAYKIETKLCNKGDSIIAPSILDVPAIKCVCPALKFQGWNYDLSVLENVQHNLQIGAMYVPSDGYSWFKVRATKTTGDNATDALSHTLNIIKPNVGVLTLRVENLDGDLISEITNADTGNLLISFNLPQVGYYWVKVAISTGVYSIGADAFGEKPKSGILTGVYLGRGVVNIVGGAFSGCYSLSSVILPQGVLSIGNIAFEGCSSLTSIVIPKGVTTIGEWVFSSCSTLISTTIPQGVVAVGNGMFSGCSGMVTLTIPQGVTAIGDWAFSGCYGLLSLTIPKGIITIGDAAFNYCSNLTLFSIPQGVTTIGNDVFGSCSGLSELTIPQSVVNIGSGVFDSCSGLKSLVIPQGVTGIESGMFTGCSGLVSITIPQGVTTIGDGAFVNCLGLNYVVVSKEVVSIGVAAFSNCLSLLSVDFSKHVSIPELADNSAFDGCDLMVIVVPDNLYDQWIVAANWSVYKNYIIKYTDYKKRYQNYKEWSL